jgi:hypothetical protein
VDDQRGNHTHCGLVGQTVGLTEPVRRYTVAFTTPNRDTMNNVRLRFWFRPYATKGMVCHIDRVILRVPVVWPASDCHTKLDGIHDGRGWLASGSAVRTRCGTQAPDVGPRRHRQADRWAAIRPTN